MIDLTVKCDQIAGSEPLTLSLKADRKDRQALARRFDWIDVVDLRAEIKLETIARGAFHASGKIESAIVQKCRVTGNPVPESLIIAVDERFAATKSGDDNAEIDPMAVSVEAIENDEVPIGEMIAQLVGLEASAWPRDAAADGHLPEHDAGPTKPFASLAELKKKL
jgi:uncharacterized metal-binding protein YceD (DUF177 family)